MYYVEHKVCTDTPRIFCIKLSKLENHLAELTLCFLFEKLHDNCQIPSFSSKMVGYYHL